MILDEMPEVKNLTADQKLVLIGELWDELAANPSDVPVPEGVLDELDRRFEEYEEHPDPVTTWGAAKDRIRASRK